MKDFASLASLGPDELWNADVAGRYDTPGSGSFAPEVLGPMVDRLARLAAPGRCWSSPSGAVGSRSRSSSEACL